MALWRTTSVLVLTAACVLDPVDLSAKECPCDVGFVCDDAANRCVVSTQPTCDALVTATDFRASWATSVVIRWEWTPIGLPDDLLRYELVLQDEDGEATVIGPSANPELAAFYLPQTGMDGDVVDNTLTAGLLENSTYTARLRVVDRELCVFETDMAAATTIRTPPRSIDLFIDDHGGGLTPPNHRVVSDADGGHLEWKGAEDARCDERICSQHLQLYGFDADLSERILDGSFANTAYFEFRIRYDGETPVNYASARLRFNEGDDSEFYKYIPFTLGPLDEYRTFQMPLRVFTRDDGHILAYEDLERVRMTNVAVNGQWDLETAAGTDSTISLDDIRIRF